MANEPTPLADLADSAADLGSDATRALGNLLEGVDDLCRAITKGLEGAKGLKRIAIGYSAAMGLLERLEKGTATIEEVRVFLVHQRGG